MVRFLWAAPALISAAAAQSYTTSCTGNALASPTPANYRCGRQGTLTNPSVLQGAQQVSNDNCRDQCLAQLECQSYGYDETAGACTLYATDLTKQGLKRSRSKVKFYNRQCFVSCLDTFTLQAIGPKKQSYNKAFAVNSDQGDEPVLVYGQVSNAAVYALDNYTNIYKPSTGYYWTIDPNEFTQAVLVTDPTESYRRSMSCNFETGPTLSCSASTTEGAELYQWSMSSSILTLGDDGDEGPTRVTLYVLPPFPTES